jgi:hypothetical protein
MSNTDLIPDFARSFFTFRIDLEAQPAITLTHKPPTTLNNARIQLECCCTITKPDGEEVLFALGASCKTEQVGAPGDLWLRPNADFCLIASHEEFLIIKQFAHRGLSSTVGARERQTGRVNEAWINFRFEVERLQATELPDFDAIFEATMANRILVARSEWEENGYGVRLEYPVKTFNVTERERVYQTDTGPNILPDLSPERLAASQSMAECFDLAFSAFNAPDWIEFVINAPQDVADGVAVDHYHQIRRIDNARNTLRAY